MKYWPLIFLLFADCTSADHDTPERADIAYSFWVAGHTYGKAGKENPGLFPPFMTYRQQTQKHPGMKFGVLTGDTVLKGTSQDWKDVDRDVQSFGMPVHFALGNHEYLNPVELNKRFPKTYFSFWQDQDIHIILDPNLDQWNISGAQFKFLKTTLAAAQEKARNVFVYSHQVLWWSPDNAYSNLLLNSPAGRSAKTNFWTEVVPLLEAMERPVFCFAGDVGAANWAEDFTDHAYGNIRLIASGMGKDEGSNFIVVEVFKNGDVKIQFVFL